MDQPTNIDGFMVDAGIVDAAQLTPEAQKALCAAAEAFLRSGLPYSLYRQLAPASRAAFIAANGVIWEERVARLAEALAAVLRGATEVDVEALKDAAASAGLNQWLAGVDERQRAEFEPGAAEEVPA